MVPVKRFNQLERMITSQSKNIEGQARDITRLNSQLETQASLAVAKGPLSPTRPQCEEYVMTAGHSTKSYLTSEAWRGG